MLESLKSARTRIGFFIAGSIVCLCGAWAKLPVGVCVHLCGGEYMRGCLMFGSFYVGCVFLFF